MARSASRRRSDKVRDGGRKRRRDPSSDDSDREIDNVQDRGRKRCRNSPSGHSDRESSRSTITRRAPKRKRDRSEDSRENAGGEDPAKFPLPAPILFHGPHGKFSHPVSLSGIGSPICGCVDEGSKRQCGIVLASIEALRVHLKIDHGVTLGGSVLGRRRPRDEDVIEALREYFAPGGQFWRTKFKNPQFAEQRVRMACEFLQEFGDGARSAVEFSDNESFSAKRFLQHEDFGKKLKEMILEGIAVGLQSAYKSRHERRKSRHERRKSRASA